MEHKLKEEEEQTENRQQVKRDDIEKNREISSLKNKQKKNNIRKK